ncbi:Glycosyltransferase [beta proteobacterium CB]|nr:selenoneine biosynthesis selenosugar synthase SenB [uncultured Polynucleobacter sp.]AGG33927.1 Glycosyltransferase [beta proteobacterium CB]
MKPLIEIVTPAPPGSLHGNRITAMRWQRLLKSLGYQSSITEAWSGKPCDLLVALHAKRSHQSIQRFKKLYPTHPVVLVMTGTDIYRDFDKTTKVIDSMKMADAIVVLQSKALESLPKRFHKKVTVIYQSISTVTRKIPPKGYWLSTLIGHLRPEKDPFCAPHSLDLIPAQSQLKLIHLGKAMSPSMERQAIAMMEHQSRYQWLGELSHGKTLQWLARSNIMVISSRMEGGAHVVSEAIAIGVPVIASDIPGNRGLLGDDYPAYFPVGDIKALSELLYKAESNPSFYQKLNKAILTRKKLVQPELERRSIQVLMKKLLAN